MDVRLAPEEVEYAEVTNQEGVRVLQRNADGSCVYLDPRGRCSIHEIRPQTCREFDCRHVFALYTRDERRAMANQSSHIAKIFLAGRERLRTGSVASRCQGKRVWPSKATANTMAARTRGGGDGRMEVYHCTACHGWHVGSAIGKPLDRRREITPDVAG